MDFHEPGVLDTSEHYFLRPSRYAVEHLYFVQSVGRFDVTSAYKVSRLNYASFLMLIVTRGTLCGRSGDRAVTAAAGEVLLLDCRRPHDYYAVNPASFVFLHFGGGQSEALFRLLTADGLVIAPRTFDACTAAANALLTAARNASATDEPHLSAMVYTLLMSLLHSGSRGDDIEHQAVADAEDYILSHLSDTLTVAGLAARCGFSASYFTRAFKHHAGMPPYQFILGARLDHARHLLFTTDQTVQQIADISGFGTLANFSSAFRKRYGVTPTQARRQPL